MWSNQLQISNRDRCARGVRGCIEARGAPIARRGTSLTIEERMMGAPVGAPETALRDHGIAQRTSHSCVVGLRARLKPERFWFDSRGWDDRGNARARLVPVLATRRGLPLPPGPSAETGRARARTRVGSKMVMHRFLKPRDVGSIPTRPTKDQRTRHRAPTLVRQPGLERPHADETAKQVKCCGDTPVRHTGIRGFNSPHLLCDQVSVLRTSGRFASAES